jgi:hypothetical protein
MEIDSMVDYQKKTVELLEELEKWTRFTSMPHVRQVLLDTLNTNEKKIAYLYSDDRNSRDVAGLANVDASSAQDWRKKWIKVGLAEPVKVQREERAKKASSLEDFGTEVPKPKSVKAEQEVSPSPVTDESTEVKKDE